MSKILTPRVKRAIDIYLDAINAGTLAKGTCCACAVGNLVAAGMGAEIIIEKDPFTKEDMFFCNMDIDSWSLLFMTSSSRIQKIDFDYLNDYDVKANISATEFKWQELAAIENAFENASEISFVNYWKYKKAQIRADQIKGIEAVIKVMMTFDDCIDVDVEEVFTNKLNALV